MANCLDIDPGGATDQSLCPMISDVILGVVNWWCLKYGNLEVVGLIKRHFEHEEVYKAAVTLANSCKLSKPVQHKNTANRPAIEPCASDLVKVMKDLIEANNIPTIVIPSSELGKVPLDSLSVGYTPVPQPTFSDVAMRHLAPPGQHRTSGVTPSTGG